MELSTAYLSMICNPPPWKKSENWLVRCQQSLPRPIASRHRYSKSCPDVFSRLIARLATLSFREGRFPDSYKTASVTSLLKKKDSDQENLANFRPISNLHTISKLLEKLILSRIMPHVENSTNFKPFPVSIQTGLLDRIRHTQTAQWCVLRCWWKTSIDDSFTWSLRSVRHHRHWYTFSGVWSTLSESPDQHSSGWKHTSRIDRNWKWPVRGGILRVRRSAGFSPRTGAFFNIVAPIAGVISSFGVHHTQYADDTQLYVELRTDAVETLDSCFQAVHRWFIENGLALNPDKSVQALESRQEGRIDVMTLWQCFNHCVWLSQEPGRHHRWDSLFQHPRQQRLQGILLPHQGTATCTRMHWRGNCTNGGQLNCWCPTRLLQFSTAWHHHLEHQQNPVGHQHASSSGHRHWKTLLTNCVDAVKDWMARNRLRLNPSKTEVIWLGSSRAFRLIRCLFLDPGLLHRSKFETLVSQ